MALFYTLVIRKPDTDGEENGGTDLRKNEEWIHNHWTDKDLDNPEMKKLVAQYKTNIPEPPDEEYLEAARQER